MNWVCVLEQALAGMLVFFLLGCLIAGVAMFFRTINTTVKESEWAQRRANRPPSRPTKFDKWWINKGRDLFEAVLGGVAVVAVLVALFAGVVIPMGKSILNLAMGRECW